MDAMKSISVDATPKAIASPEPNAPIIKQLGIQPYSTIWHAMKQFVSNRTDGTPDEIWILEHQPVFTLGQAGNKEHILNPGSIPIVQSDRGGQVTYHGPGQLIAYLMIDWSARGWHSRSLVNYIEAALIDLLAEFNIPCHAKESAPGIYTEQDRKIASLGLRMKRQSSYHGLALNVNMDLAPFSLINPCGFKGLEMAQLRDFCPDISVPKIASQLSHHLTTKLCNN